MSRQKMSMTTRLLFSPPSSTPRQTFLAQIGTMLTSKSFVAGRVAFDLGELGFAGPPCVGLDTFGMNVLPFTMIPSLWTIAGIVC